MSIQIVELDGEGDPLVYWSFGVAALSFVWTVAWSWWTNNRSSIRDYWFHEVVGPRSVEPLLDFSNKWMGRCKGLAGCANPVHAVQELNLFGQEKDQLLGQVWISKLLFEDVYEFACKELDGVEDEFGVAVGKIAAIAVGANGAPPDFDDVCRSFENAILRVLGRLAGAKFRI